MVSAGLWRAQVDAFMDELGRVDTHGTLCTTPLLLNLMLSEYLRHEARDSAIRFDGAPPTSCIVRQPCHCCCHVAIAPP